MQVTTRLIPVLCGLAALVSLSACPEITPVVGECAEASNCPQPSQECQEAVCTDKTCSIAVKAGFCFDLASSTCVAEGASLPADPCKVCDPSITQDSLVSPCGAGATCQAGQCVEADASADADVGADAVVDVGPDVSDDTVVTPDAEPDGTLDVTLDAQPDAAPDVTPDVDPDVSQPDADVVNTNPPPVFDPMADEDVVEGYEVSFAVSAVDPDGGSVIYAATSLPPGATFDDATGLFSWTPGFDVSDYVSGSTPVTATFTATDDGVPASVGTLDVTINVHNDEDQDGLADGADGCPWHYDPSQLDFDGDGVGLACDAAIAIPAGVWTPQNPAVNLALVGHRGDAVAFRTFPEDEWCSSCPESAGLFIQPPDVAMEMGPYAMPTFPFDYQTTQQPIVAGDGAIWVSWAQQDTQLWVDGVMSSPYPGMTGVTPIPVGGGQVAVVLAGDLDVWSGDVMTSVASGVTSVTATSTDDWFYAITSDGGTATLHAIGPDGTVQTVTSGEAIEFEESAPSEDGDVWVCVRPPGATPSMRLFNGATEVADHAFTLPGATGCNGNFIEITLPDESTSLHDQAGARWIRMEQSGSAYGYYRWTGPGVASADEMLASDRTFRGMWAGGDHRYMMLACPGNSNCSELYAHAGNAMQWVASGTVLEAFQSGAGAHHHVGRGGHFVNIHQAANFGSGANPTEIRVWTYLGTSTLATNTLVPTGNTYISFTTWHDVDGNGTAWIRVNHGPTTGNTQTNVWWVNGGNAGTTGIDVAPFNSTGLVEDAPPSGDRLLLTDGGTYRITGTSTTQVELTHTGMATLLMGAEKATVDGHVWLAYETAGGWNVASWSNGVMTVSGLTGLSQEPEGFLDADGYGYLSSSEPGAFQAVALTNGIATNFVSATSGSVFAGPKGSINAQWSGGGFSYLGRLANGGLVNTFAGGDAVTLAGPYAVVSMTSADPTVYAVCALDGSGACFDLPINDDAVSGVTMAQASDGSGAGVVLSSANEAYLWRGLDLPTPASCCSAQSGPGCDSGAVSACVCGADSVCCTDAWSADCVDLVESLGCGVCGQ